MSESEKMYKQAADYAGLGLKNCLDTAGTQLAASGMLGAWTGGPPDPMMAVGRVRPTARQFLEREAAELRMRAERIEKLLKALPAQLPDDVDEVLHAMISSKGVR